MLREAGLSDRDTVQAFHAFGGYIQGFVMMEGGSIKGAHDDELPPIGMTEALPADDFPVLAAVGRYFAECTADEQFEFGLDLMIRGIVARAQPTGPALMNVDAFLADAVQASGGKLHALGIGWSRPAGERVPRASRPHRDRRHRPQRRRRSRRARADDLAARPGRVARGRSATRASLRAGFATPPATARHARAQPGRAHLRDRG